MESIKTYITELLASGRYFFSKDDALKELELNDNQFKLQVNRLIKKKLIARLTRDFFMIISPEYYNLGSLPPHWIIDPLMKHLHQDYYIGLLSAASLYGSTEQQPMVFQIITDKPTRTVHLERTTIEFYLYKYCSTAQKTTLSVPTGYVNISTKEQTIIDLVRLYQAAGHLDNVALVIKSLAQECDALKLAQAITHENLNPVLQRLGYILEVNKFPELAKSVLTELTKRKIKKYALLKPDHSIKTGQENNTWKLIINDTLEIE